MNRVFSSISYLILLVNARLSSAGILMPGTHKTPKITVTDLILHRDKFAGESTA